MVTKVAVASSASADCPMEAYIDDTIRVPAALSDSPNRFARNDSLLNLLGRTFAFYCSCKLPPQPAAGTGCACEKNAGRHHVGE
jgi:hypothetical protein